MTVEPNVKGGEPMNVDSSVVWSRNKGGSEKSASSKLIMYQKLSSKINDSIERQMVQAASSGKLTIMKSKGNLNP